MPATLRTVRVRRKVPASPRKPRTVRTIVLTVLCTVLAVTIGLGVLGTVLPAQQPAAVVKTITVKPAG